MSSVLKLSEDEFANLRSDIDTIFDNDFGFSFDLLNLRQGNVQLSAGLFRGKLDGFFGNAKFTIFFDIITITVVLFNVEVNLPVVLERLMIFEDLVEELFWECKFSIYLFSVIVPQPQLIFNWSFLLYLNQRLLNVWQFHRVGDSELFVGGVFLVEKGKDFTEGEQELIEYAFYNGFDGFKVEGVHKFVDSTLVGDLIAVGDVSDTIVTSIFEFDFQERNCDSFVFGDFLSDGRNLVNCFLTIDSFLADFSKTVFKGADRAEHYLDRGFVDLKEFVYFLERLFGKSSLFELF